MNHFYHIPGVTDVSVQKAQAEKGKAQGKTSWVHEHSRLEGCNDMCELYEPQKENQDGKP